MENKDASQKRNDTGREINSGNQTSRRNAIKALAGIPFLGALGYAFYKDLQFSKKDSFDLLSELNLKETGSRTDRQKQVHKDLIRIGIIGYGSRAVQLTSALGFLHPSDEEKKRKDKTLADWLAQENLNVAVTAICEVFDLRAQKGIETVSNSIQPQEMKHLGIPVKRYSNYKELLADKDIDAVIIATPDHHHAQMAIDAAKAGKHVYCEKSVSLYEDKLYELYDVVKNSDIVYQLGHQITKNVTFQKAREVIEKNVLGKITLIETTSNRNTAAGAWIRHLDDDGNPKPGDQNSIDWKQWLGPAPYAPFSVDRYYNWTKWFDYNNGLWGQLFSHEYDAVNQLLGVGIPDSVVASGGKYYWKDNRDMPDVLNAVFEYKDRDLSFVYSASLASSRQRGRVLMGHDASMELGNDVIITPDRNSTKYKHLIENGSVDPSYPMLTLTAGGADIDAVSSATEKYYASRGLTSTIVDGKKVDITHLHIKEWLDCIRYGGVPTANIDKAFEEGITLLMGHKAYLEGRKIEWDPIARKIV
uniref:Gfo/Idh/MocA family protein n=1 Tax=uncultured Draconibacterium sp. TaxID=1573823 RepID=UPI003217CDAE